MKPFRTLLDRARSGSPLVWTIGLWSAFLIVHAIVLQLGWWLPNQPMGDVPNVYAPWSSWAVDSGYLVGVDEPWVYPPLALLPMVAARLFFFVGDYIHQWSLLVTVLNAVGFGVLLGRGRSVPRRVAAAFWLVFVLALGPVGLYRIDAITVPLAVVAVLWIARRPKVAALLLAVGAWIKIWPGALVIAAVVALRSRVSILVTAIGTSVVVAATVVALGGAGNLFGFLTEQSDRGLQVEAPISLAYVWGALIGVRGTSIHYNSEIITFQVTGPGASFLASAMTPLLVLVAGAVAALGILRLRAGVPARRLLPPLALALVTVFIVVNKVGSPQFHTWLLAPIVLWLLWDRRAALPFAVAAAASALLTQLIYPVFYDLVLAASPFGVILLTARNCILIGLLIGSVRHVASLGREPVDVLGAARRATATIASRAVTGPVETRGPAAD